MEKAYKLKVRKIWKKLLGNTKKKPISGNVSNIIEKEIILSFKG